AYGYPQPVLPLALSENDRSLKGLAFLGSYGCRQVTNGAGWRLENLERVQALRGVLRVRLSQSATASAVSTRSVGRSFIRSCLVPAIRRIMPPISQARS